MTFSANPARISLRERIRRLDGPRRALLHVVVAALALMALGTVLAFFLARTVVAEQAAQFGNALAAESAQRAAEYLVHDDLVSLNVVTSSLIRLPGIVGVTVYDRYRQPLAQSGHVQPTPDTMISRALILTEEQDLRGSVELLIDPSATSPSLSRLHYTLAGWLAFTLVMLLLVTRLQREYLVALPVAGVDARPPLTTEHGPGGEIPTLVAIDHDVPEPVAPTLEGVLLRLDIVNLATLEQRLAPRVLADALAWYGKVLAGAAALYHGQVCRPLGEQALVVFAGADGQDEDEVLFRAICCAQLFLGVVRETTTARKAAGSMALQFTAALHHDPAMGYQSRADVTWEICAQAGVAGRLTVTDPVSQHPVLGERLVFDTQHRQVLHIDTSVPGVDTGAHNDQAHFSREVIVLGILRMAEPYEDLLARQVQCMCEPSATNYADDP